MEMERISSNEEVVVAKGNKSFMCSSEDHI